MPLALEYKRANKLNNILPIPFDNYNFYTAKAFLDFVGNKHAKNLPIYSQNGNWNQLKRINQVGLFIMGEKDGFAFNNAANHLQTINQNSKNKNNKIRIINDCGHTFADKEEELANEILTFIQTC